MCADWVHDRHPSSAAAAPGPPGTRRGPALRLRVRPRARLEPARVRMLPAHRDARLRPDRQLTPAATSRTPASRSSSSTTTARASPGWSCCTRARARRAAAWCASTRSRPGSSRGRRLLAHTRVMADFGERRAELPRRPAARRACGCCPTPAASRSTRSGPPGSNVGGVFRAGAGLRDRQRDRAVRPRALPSAWCSTSASPAARTTRPAGTRTARATSAPSCTRAGWCATAAPSRFRTDAHGRRARRRAAPGGGAPRPRRPAARVLRRRERLRHGAPSDGGIYRAGRGRRARATSSSRATACSARTSSRAARPRSRACCVPTSAHTSRAASRSARSSGARDEPPGRQHERQRSSWCVRRMRVEPRPRHPTDHLAESGRQRSGRRSWSPHRNVCWASSPLQHLLDARRRSSAASASAERAATAS